MRLAWKLVLPMTLLLAQACSIEQPVSGPVLLTSEWKTVEPPEPLRKGRLEQRLCLDVGATQDVDFEKGVVVLGNGQRHTLAGEVIDNERTTYPLEVAEQGRTVRLNRAERSAPEPDFPSDRTIVRVRLRSEPPLQVAEIGGILTTVTDGDHGNTDDDG